MTPSREVDEFERRYAEWERSHVLPGDPLDLLARAASESTPPAEAVEAIAFLQRWLGGRERTVVAKARAEGASWAQIGTALGCSKQAAWERYQDLE